MTVIAIRDGIMAVDSLVTGGGAIFGAVKKFAAVPGKFGGGYIAAAGDLGVAVEVMSKYIDFGQAFEFSDEVVDVHLRADGSVLTNDGGGWYAYEAPFYAAGSGDMLAIGAMAAGADAATAARIAADHSMNCGGEIHIVSVQPC